MNYIEMTVKILLYFILVFMMYFYIKGKNKKGNNKFTVLSIIIFSSLFGLYSVIAGNLSDRMRYGNFFSSPIYDYIIQRDSLGLFSIYKFLHLFSYNRYFLFFGISFIFCFLSMVAYNKYEKIQPISFLLMGISNYFIWGLLAFKQCFAVAFIALSWVYYINGKNKWYIIFLIIAILFHETALIMIPVYLCLNTLNKSNLLRVPLYICLLVSVLFFNQISSFIFSLASYIPSLEFQMSSYFDELGSVQNELNVLTIFKGAPFFIITFYGIIKRKLFLKKIDNYDKYLFISFFCSLTFLLSFRMYWMWRFGMYCLFPTFSFLSQVLYKCADENDNRYVYIAVVGLLLFITVRYFVQCYFTYGGIF